jgi:ribosomal protein S18 acetylase RimI-like enzyme
MESIENAPVEISEASLDDAGEIFNIQKLTWLATYPNEEIGISRAAIENRFANKDGRIEKWKQTISSGESKIWIAKIANRAVGFCGVKEAPEINRLASIYVDPNQQGGGIGSKLIEFAIKHLGRSKDIILDVASYNSSAINFYQKKGFEVLGDTPGEELLNVGGVNLPETRMMLKKMGE